MHLLHYASLPIHLMHDARWPNTTIALCKLTHPPAALCKVTEHNYCIMQADPSTCGMMQGDLTQLLHYASWPIHLRHYARWPNPPTLTLCKLIHPPDAWCKVTHPLVAELLIRCVLQADPPTSCWPFHLLLNADPLTYCWPSYRLLNHSYNAWRTTSLRITIYLYLYPRAMKAHFPFLLNLSTVCTLRKEIWANFRCLQTYLSVKLSYIFLFPE